MIERRRFVKGLASTAGLMMASPWVLGQAAQPTRLRPKAVAFDVIETLFDLKALRPHLVGAGLPDYSLELFFAQMLRDGFALAASGSILPFGQLAANSLTVTSANLGKPLTLEQAKAILANVASLPAHPDVADAFKYLKAQNVTLITLTNSSTGNTEKLLEKAGVREYIDHLWPASDSGQWKPATTPYQFAANKLGLPIERVALVAAHPWDIHGAINAGMTGAYIERQERLYQPSFLQPHLSDTNMLSLAKSLMALPA